VGDRLYLSGQIGISEDGSVSDDPETQFTVAFEHVKAVLEGAGKTMDDVVEMTTFHVGLQEHAAVFMAVKDRYMKEPYPAWTAIGITELFIPGGLVEIKVIAVA
jgi:enamine deaminase RidA (YjgF/YER057c/UK114 family)